MLIRSVVPAMAATLAVYLGLAFAAWLYLRQHYLTPLTVKNLFNPTRLRVRGVAFAAWALAAFAIGALPGMLVRRVVSAIAATLATYAGLAFACALYLRQHYLTPLVTSTQNVPGSAFITSQWGTKDGRCAFAGAPLSLLQQICPAPPPGTRGPSHADKVLTIARCLSQHGYTWWTSYQPASRFWPFQWIEGGWLLALSVLCIAATVWLVRRRAA